MSTKNFPHTSKDKRAVSVPKHDVFHAIADPTRRQMLQLLADNELSIAAIAQFFPISRTAVNKHLHILAEAGLVSCRKAGRETRYKLEPKPLTELKTWLSFFEQYWDERLAALKHLVEADEEPS
ncbi:metalloregulator ArsR/SmtB family transcription factor [Geobacillus thermoleovorans]|uniref:ArsR/SmtB family transcription factor n=1 Tax=Geobacillus thermoleovorans TaxID=33941 RepID=UPI00345C2F1E